MMNDQKSNLQPSVILAIIIACILPLLGGLLAQNNWGMNQAEFLSSTENTIWLIFLAISLGLLFFPRKNILSDSFIDTIWADNGLKLQIILPLLFVVIAILSHVDIHIYGDGYLEAANLGNRDNPVFHWYEFGGTLIPYLIFMVLKTIGTAKVEASFAAFQITSYLSGFIFTFFAVKISSLVFERNSDRTFTLSMILVSGLAFLFFGLIETVVLLPAWTAFLIYAVIKGLKSPSVINGIIIWAVALIGVFIHIIALASIPAVLYVTLCCLGKDKRGGLGLEFFISLALALAGMVVVYLISAGNLFIEDRLLFLQGKPPLVDYGIIGGDHWMAIVNLLILFIPLLPLVLLAAFKDIFSGSDNKITGMFIVLTFGQLILLFIIDPINGMFREIPYHGSLLTGLIIWGAYCTVSYIKRHTSTIIQFGRLPIVGLVLLLPMLSVHTSPAKTILYLDNCLEKNETKYEPALIAMRNYYFNIGEYELAQKREAVIRSKAPGTLESELILDLYANGNFTKALMYADRLVERYPYNPTYHMQRGNVLKYYKRYDEAKKEFEKALELAPERGELYHFMSEFYRELNDEERCREFIDRGLEWEPHNNFLIIDLTDWYFRKNDLNRTDSLADVALAINHEEAYAYLYKGLVADRTGRREKAIDHYLNFLKNGKNLPETNQIRGRLELLSPGILNNPGSDSLNQ